MIGEINFLNLKYKKKTLKYTLKKFVKYAKYSESIIIKIIFCFLKYQKWRF